MFGNWRRGIAAAVSALSMPAVVTLIALSAGTARAGEIEDQLKAPQKPETLFGIEATSLTPSAAELEEQPVLQASEQAKLWSADFHPETDRWTERNNRIKISLYGAGLFFGNNLRIHHDAAIGLRVSWEVPGFIGIRFDGVAIPWSHMLVRNTGKVATGSSWRTMKGFVVCNSLSIAIFNPELSAVPNLAMWAGFGVDWWNYHYNQLIRTAGGTSRRYQYIDYNFGGNLFFNLEYKINDFFHVGFEIREHIVYAPQTERGQFYKVDNLVQGVGLHTVGRPHDRNQDLPGELPLSAVHEFQLHVAVVF